MHAAEETMYVLRILTFPIITQILPVTNAAYIHYAKGKGCTLLHSSRARQGHVVGGSIDTPQRMCVCVNSS